MQVFWANGFNITDFTNLPFVYCLLFTSLSLSPLTPTLLLKRLHLLPTWTTSLCVSPFRSLSCQTQSSTEIIRTSEEMESVSGAARRPCFVEEDDGLASLADMEAGFSGSNHPFYSRPMCFARRSGSFRNVSPAMASFSSSSSFSPRSGRFCDARFEEHHQPHFLDACFLCKKPLGDNRDIFMYRLVDYPLQIHWSISLFFSFQNLAILVEFCEQINVWVSGNLNIFPENKRKIPLFFLSTAKQKIGWIWEKPLLCGLFRFGRNGSGFDVFSVNNKMVVGFWISVWLV